MRLSSNRFTKFAEGDLVYKYYSEKNPVKEGDVGIAIEVLIGQEGDEPHVVYQLPDGSKSPIFDCSRYGYGGGVPKSAENATAIVKWLYDGAKAESVSVNDAHQRWPVEQVTARFALAKDPWDKRMHWLPRVGDYSFRTGNNERSHLVTMQSLIL